MFISFEGLDGCGKTSQIQLLAERLERNNLTVQLIREPGGTDISERIRDILLDKKYMQMNQVAELFLFSAARAQLVTQIIKPALAASKIVLCDRFMDSSTAYQGYGRELRVGAVKTINTVATLGLLPNLTFFFDVPIDTLIERRRKEGKPVDRMESNGRVFFEKVREGYLAIAEEEKTRFVVIDGSESIKMIHEQIWKLVLSRLNKEGK